MKELETTDGLDYQIEDPISILADLTAIGIEEVDKGICEDSFENRRLLRRSKLIWEPVYSSTGTSTGLLKVRSAESTRERRIESLAAKRPVLVTPTDNNSDYLTGLDLIAEEASDYLVPPWVIGATRKWLKEQENGGPLTDKRQPVPMPHRCKVIKHDQIRCMLWGSGRLVDDGMCRVHLRTIKRKTSDDIELARTKLTQAAPYAVDVLEDLMMNAESEPVMLKAASEILDRAGLRGAVEINTNINLELRPAADVIAERLSRISAGAVATAARLSQLVDEDVVDAEEVIEEESAGGTTSNEEEDAAAASSSDQK